MARAQRSRLTAHNENGILIRGHITACRLSPVASQSPIGSDASAPMARSSTRPASSRRRAAAPIMAALSVVRSSRGTNTGSPACWPRSTASARSRRLAETPPAIPTDATLNQRAAANVRSSSAPTTARWKLAQMSAISRSREHVGRGGRWLASVRLPPRVLLAPSHVAQDRRLQAAEAEVGLPFQGGRKRARHAAGRAGRAVVTRHARDGERHRAIVAARREPVDDRPAWIPEPEQFRHLVVGLPSRVVSGATDQVILARGRKVIEARVAARHHQDDGG